MKVREHPAVQAAMKRRKALNSAGQVKTLLIIGIGTASFDELRRCDDISELALEFDRSLDGSIDIPQVGRFLRNLAVGGALKISEVNERC